jgi:hypothetical protein
MPLNVLARGGIFIAIVSLANLARADEPPCVPRGAVRIDVQPDPHDPSLGRRTMEQIFSELAENAAACAGTDDAPSPSIVVEWLPAHRARIRVVLQTKRKDWEIQRNLELEGVPADGIPLAVAIAADELVITLFDRTASEPVEPPPPPTAPPAAPAKVEVAAPPALPRVEFGLRLGVEQLTSGLGMAGPDATIKFFVTAHAEVVLRAGLRAPWLVGDGARPLTASRFGTWVRIGTDVRQRWGVAGALGIDAAFTADEARAIPIAGAVLWRRLGSRFVVSLDLHVGPAISSSATYLKGLEMGAGIGIDTIW